MGTYKLIVKAEYEVEAESEEEAYEGLVEKFAIENTTANNEFWNCLVVKEVK